MYLEISGRRTGKTTRLVEAAEKKQQELEKEGSTLTPVIYTLCPRILPDTTVQVVMYTPGCVSSAYPFFDEFDWMEGVPISENGYYVTSPRDGVQIERLLDANNREYVCRQTNKVLADSQKEFLQEDIWAKEFLARFN